MTDLCELLEFLESRNSFSDNCSLRSIATGINAGISWSVDTAKEVGEKILTSMAQQNLLQHSFKKNTKLSHSVHRLSKPTMNQYRSIHNCCFKGSSLQELGNDQLEEIFEFELCSYPPAIRSQICYEACYKPTLADDIWSLMPKDVVGPTGQSQYALWRVPGAPNTVAAGYNLQWHNVDCTQTTSQEDMDMQLLRSTVPGRTIHEI